MNRTHRRRGFEMIELLTVVLTIGVLSAVAMLAFTEVTASAKAAKIMNDMKTIRIAVTSWYLDSNMDRVIREDVDQDYRGTYKVYTKDRTEAPQFVGVYAHSKEGGKEFLSYIGNGANMDFASPFDDDMARAGKYYLRSENNGRWYVSYTFDAHEKRVRKKLADNGDAAELVGDIVPYNPDGTKSLHSEKRFDPAINHDVSMLILNFE